MKFKINALLNFGTNNSSCQIQSRHQKELERRGEEYDWIELDKTKGEHNCLGRVFVHYLQRLQQYKLIACNF